MHINLGIDKLAKGEAAALTSYYAAACVEDSPLSCELLEPKASLFFPKEKSSVD